MGQRPTAISTLLSGPIGIGLPDSTEVFNGGYMRSTEDPTDRRRSSSKDLLNPGKTVGWLD